MCIFIPYTYIFRSISLFLDLFLMEINQICCINIYTWMYRRLIVCCWIKMGCTRKGRIVCGAYGIHCMSGVLSLTTSNPLCNAIYAVVTSVIDIIVETIVVYFVVEGRRMREGWWGMWKCIICCELIGKQEVLDWRSSLSWIIRNLSMRVFGMSSVEVEREYKTLLLLLDRNHIYWIEKSFIIILNME